MSLGLLGLLASGVFLTLCVWGLSEFGVSASEASGGRLMSQCALMYGFPSLSTYYSSTQRDGRLLRTYLSSLVLILSYRFLLITVMKAATKVMKTMKRGGGRGSVLTLLTNTNCFGKKTSFLGVYNLQAI